jgi:hypothetical protein
MQELALSGAHLSVKLRNDCRNSVETTAPIALSVFSALQ